MAENNGLHVCYSISKECWNMGAWGSGICHHCECCSKDKRERYESRIRLMEERLEELKAFRLWDDNPKVRALQEKNIASSIKRIKRKLRYYTEKVNAMKEAGDAT